MAKEVFLFQKGVMKGHQVEMGPKQDGKIFNAIVPCLGYEAHVA